MKHTLLKKNGPLLATMATLLLVPALTHAATVIDHVPYTITASGKYELDSDLTANGTVGITVRAANVVINLNGFTLTQSQVSSDKDGIDVLANNVILRNGTVSGFGIEASAISLRAAVGKAEDLRLVGNQGTNILIETGNDNTVVNCVIIGNGETAGSFGIVVRSGSADLLKDNQISECLGGIDTRTDVGSAIIHNYVANALKGVDLSGTDYYQGNVVTGCTLTFRGGNAIGTENGGD